MNLFRKWILLAAIGSFFVGMGIPLSATGMGDMDSDSPVRIELWSLLKGDRAKLLDEQTERFNQNQKNVVVSVIHQGGYSELGKKITAAASAGNLPAIFMADYLDVGFYAQQGILSPVSGLLSDKKLNEFYPEMLEDLKIDGKIYGIPYTRSIQGIYVNLNLLEKAGIKKSPETWDELLEQSRQLKKLGKNYYYGYSFFHQWFFDAIAYSWGSILTTNEGKVTINDNKIVSMMNYFQKMKQEGLFTIPPKIFGSLEEKSGGFLQGKVASVFESSSWLTTVGNVVEFDWAFVPIPAGSGGHSVTVGGGNFVIANVADVRQREAAARFLDYISGPEQSAEVHIQTGYLPTSPDVLNVPEVKTLHKNKPYYADAVAELKNAKPVPGYTKNIRGVWYRITTGPIARILMNDEDAQSVLDETAAEFQLEIDQALEQGEYIR